jgi:hypothetical protein
MSNAKERIASIDQRMEALLSGLDASAGSSTHERDLEVVRLLVSAAEHAALAEEIDGDHILGQMLVGGTIEIPFDEGSEESVLGEVTLLGLSQLTFVVLPAQYPGEHRGACISPDPSALFPEKDAARPQPPSPEPGKKADSQVAAPSGTTGGDKQQEQNVFHLRSSDPDAALEEVTIELLTRAERLIDQAEQVKAQPPAAQSAPELKCSAGGFS